MANRFTPFGTASPSTPSDAAPDATGARFTPAAAPSSGNASSSRFTPSSSPSPSGASETASGGGETALANNLALTGGAATLGKLGATVAGSDSLARGFGTIGDLAQLGSGAQAMASGHPASGALQTTAGLGASLRDLAPRFDFGGATGATLGGAVTGAAGVGAGALNLAQGNVPGGIQNFLASGAQLANLAPASATMGGVPISAAGGVAAGAIGEGVALGAEGAAAGAEAGLMGLDVGGMAGIGASVAAPSLAAGLGAMGGVLAAGFAIRDLVNMGLNEYKQGDLSKRIMAAKQTSLAGHGGQAMEQSLETAPTFQAAWQSLSNAPGGTSGQIQFGIGNEYAGETKGGEGGTTQTPGWSNIVQQMSDPTTLANHPDLVASAIQKLWVQQGPGGAAVYNGDATRSYQSFLLSKLPYTPEWNIARNAILNSAPTDPRQASTDHAPVWTPQGQPAAGDQYLRVGYAKIDTTHQYGLYRTDTVPPRMEPLPAERVAMMAATGTPQPRIHDLTTGTSLGTGDQTTYDSASGMFQFQKGTALDPAYYDINAPLSPYWQAQVKAGQTPSDQSVSEQAAFSPGATAA